MFQGTSRFNQAICGPTWEPIKNEDKNANGRNILTDTMFANSPGGILCCDKGSYLNRNGEDFGCSPCPPGEYQNDSKYNQPTACKRCTPGFFQDYRSAVNCSACPVGYEQGEAAKAFCLPCFPGKYQNEAGMQSCHKCDIGKVSAEPNSAKCNHCLAGFYQNRKGQALCLPCLPGEFGNTTGMQSCHKCEAGKVSAEPNATICLKCEAGQSSDTKGSAKCTSCAAGQFSSSDGNSCSVCPQGFYQDTSGESFCAPLADGTIVLEGGAAVVEVPLGSYIDCSTDVEGSCQFKPCPAGRYGDDPPQESACKRCPAGWSSFNSSIECSYCAKGKFASNPGVVCQDCPRGYFQPLDSAGSITCEQCPAGYIQRSAGESACLSLNWLRSEDCGANQYLNNSDIDPLKWKCESCPAGGSCSDQTITWSTLGPMFGWWKIPEAQREDRWKQVFAECLYAPACPGGENLALENRFENDHGEDMAKVAIANRSSICAVELGFLNSSRLCHACKKGFRRYRVNQCLRCPEAGQNWGLLFLGVMVVMALLAYVIRSRLRKGGNKHLHQNIKKILINYLQVISLARAFPLRWPESLNTLFEIQGALSTLGDHIVTIDCLSDESSAAKLFYLKQLVYAFFPVLLSMLSLGGWYLYGVHKGVDFFAKRSHPKMITPKDKFIVTITAIMFLIYPTLCYQALSFFRCRHVGKELYLYADLEEPCYRGRHLAMLFSLGVTQLVVYVIGLPLLVLLFLWRNYKAISMEHGAPKDANKDANSIEQKQAHHPQYMSNEEMSGLFSNPVVVTRWGLFFHR